MRFKYFLAPALFLITGGLTSCDQEKSEDPFVSSVHQMTGLNLAPETFTETLQGYALPPFSGDQKNRNHFAERREGTLAPLKILVMHYTHVNLPKTLELFTSKIADPSKDFWTSAHFVITQEDPELNIPGGKVIRLVADEKRARHAGTGNLSQWNGEIDLNENSIGIENVNTGFTESESGEKTWYPFDSHQVQSLGLLSQALIKKYNIDPSYVLAHADVAPTRKEDPGILFPWEQLYKEYGIGAWLDDDERTVEAIQEKYKPSESLPQEVDLLFFSTLLKKYGYPIEPTAEITEDFKSVLKAFKAHFSQNQNPEAYNQPADWNDMFWAWALVAKYKSKIEK